MMIIQSNSEQLQRLRNATVNWECVKTMPFFQDVKPMVALPAEGRIAYSPLPTREKLTTDVPPKMETRKRAKNIS